MVYWTQGQAGFDASVEKNVEGQVDFEGYGEIDTIKSCLGVMVDQTTSVAQFWDSMDFLTA